MAVPGRLYIEPAKSDEVVLREIGCIASDIFDNLKHTPVQAVGNNFVFELEDGDEFAVKSDLSDARSVKVYEKMGFKPLSESSLRHSLENRADNQKLNISYEVLGGKRFLNLNYHYEVAEDEDKIRDALGRYFEDYENAVRLKKTLITGELK